MEEQNNNILTNEELEELKKMIEKIDPENKVFSLTRELIEVNKENEARKLSYKKVDK